MKDLHWPGFETAVKSQLEFEKDPEIIFLCVDLIYSYWISMIDYVALFNNPIEA